MMITVLVTAKLDPTKADELSQIFGDLKKQVLANEPGVLLYQLTKGRSDADDITIVESYKDMEAVKLHSGTDYLREAGPRLRGCFIGDPSIKLYDVIA